MGHPYYDVVDNSTDFDNKLKRVVGLICKRIGKKLGAVMDDRLQVKSKKRKFLIKTLPSVEVSNFYFNQLVTSNETTTVGFSTSARL